MNNITFDSINDEISLLMKGMIQPHKEIFEEFVEGVESVDFRELLELKANEKIQQKQLVVLVIEELIRVMNQKDFGLCSRDGFIYLFNGAFWKPIDKEEFRSFLGQVAEKLGVDEIEAKHYQFRDHLLKQFLASATLPKIAENNAVLINLQNGTIEISDTISKREFKKDDFLTYQLSFSFNLGANCPQFEKFLDEVLPDKASQDIIAEFIGYCFTRKLKLEKCLFLYGTGANGKSVLFEIVLALLGRENISSFSIDNLSEEHNRALITNKLLNYSSELDSRRIFDSDNFKKMVSGEPIQCRLKYGNSFEAERYAKLAFNCNELPRDVEHTEAFFRRFLIVPFNVMIEEIRQDKELAQKIIKEELAGIFNWVLQGLRRLLEQKRFTQSEIVNKALQEFREQADSVKSFLIEENYVESEDFTIAKSLYSDYKFFCQENGYRTLGRNNFHKRLQANGITLQKREPGLVAFIHKQTSLTLGEEIPF
jgi:putative DNA primase/helicase